jgi:hypothetical protein
LKVDPNQILLQQHPMTYFAHFPRNQQKASSDKNEMDRLQSQPEDNQYNQPDREEQLGWVVAFSE